MASEEHLNSQQFASHLMSVNNPEAKALDNMLSHAKRGSKDSGMKNEMKGLRADLSHSRMLRDYVGHR